MYDQQQMDKLNTFWQNCTKMCEEGIQAQKNGDINKAIQIYETLLQQGFDGTHPYRQLCDYYHKQKMFKEEIRVIKRLRQVTPKDNYKEWDKYRWYDKRYKELTSKK